MLAIGVGTALNNPASQNRLVQISGPQVVRDADLDDVDSLNDVDVALVTDFEDLAELMRDVVLQLCSPSLTIRKLAQTADDATYQPAPGWDMTVTPRVPAGTGFNWILPDTTPAASKTLSHRRERLRPVPVGARSHPRRTRRPRSPRTCSPATRPADPTDTDYRCELRDEDGDVRVVEGDFADPANPSFDLDPIGQEIVTCTCTTPSTTQPDIALTKVNAPTEVRGDLDPPAEVTSTYTVTNPGNTPLEQRHGHRRPVRTGDAGPRDRPERRRHQPAATACSTRARRGSSPATEPRCVSRGPAGAPVNVVNTARRAGHRPDRHRRHRRRQPTTSTSSCPGIDLTKLVNGQPVGDRPERHRRSPTPTRSTNTGNTPLGSVSPGRRHAARARARPAAPTRPGNDDAILDVGETWTYSCTASPTAAVVNTADGHRDPAQPARRQRSRSRARTPTSPTPTPPP